MTFIPAFSEPQSYWPRRPPPVRPRPIRGRGAARRELPSGKTHDIAAPGEDILSPSPVQNPSMHLQLNNPGTKTLIPQVNTTPHDVETPTPPADP